MELEQRFQHPLHIAVAGVNLIDDQHLAEQAEQAQRLVFAVQHAEHRLVDGADAGGGHQRTFVVVGQPGGAARARGLVLLRCIGFAASGAKNGGSEILHQSALSVREDQAVVACEQLPKDARDAAIHRIRRRHGRQADEETVRQAARHHPMREQHGRFGLAGAGHVFEHHQRGLGW